MVKKFPVLMIHRIVSGLRYGDISPHKTRLIELLLCSIIILFGVAIFSMLVSILSSFIQDDDQKSDISTFFIGWFYTFSQMFKSNSRWTPFSNIAKN